MFVFTANQQNLVEQVFGPPACYGSKFVDKDWEMGEIKYVQFCGFGDVKIKYEQSAIQHAKFSKSARQLIHTALKFFRYMLETLETVSGIGCIYFRY